MKTGAFLISLIICFNLSFGQKRIISGYILDKENSKPIQFATISSFSHLLAATDENGYFEIKTKQPIDTLRIDHMKYKGQKIAVNNRESIKLELTEWTRYLGSLVLSDSEYINDSDCTVEKESIKSENMHQDFARFKGGMLCFDKFILTGLTKNNLIEEVNNLKTITIYFEINELGKLENVKVKSNLDNVLVEKLEEIFYESPEWKPAWQHTDKLSTKYSYKIKK